MEVFITKVSILKDSLIATGETLKESEIILITLGALGEEYESFVTSITTRFDPDMTFASLCELLMDQDMRVQKGISGSQGSINIAAKAESTKASRHLQPLNRRLLVKFVAERCIPPLTAIAALTSSVFPLLTSGSYLHYVLLEAIGKWQI